MQFWEENNIEKHFVKPVLLQVDRNDRILNDGREYSLEKILELNRDVFITGAPGSGKTSLLKYIEHKLKESIKYKTIFISFRKIANLDIARIDSKKKDYKFIFLIDGLDEVPADLRHKTTRQVEKLRNKYSKACFIITSRLATNKDIDLFEQIDVLRLSELNDAQLADLFKMHGIDDWKSAYSTIQSSVALRAAVRNPFMAKLVIQYFDVIESKEFVVDPTIYLSRLIDDYIYKASRSSNVSEPVLDELLQEVAAFLHYKKLHRFSVEDIDKLADNLLKKQSYHSDIRTLLDEMERGYIFRKVAPYTYAFSHLSIFEHFLTKHLRRLAGYRENKLILDTRQSIIIAIKLKGFNKKEALRQVFFRIERGFNLSRSQITPIYAREGSIEILLALAVGGATIHAFKKFADGYFTKLGHITAEKSSSNKEPIVLPKEIMDTLPEWIRNNEEAMNIFTTELISQHARNNFNDEKASVSIAFNSVLSAQYGDCYETMSVSQFNAPPFLGNEDNSKKNG